MSFLTAKKKDPVARCPAGEGGSHLSGQCPFKNVFLWMSSLTYASFYITKHILIFFTWIWADNSSSLMRSTIMNCCMRAVKEGCLIARALHIVHWKCRGDRSKVRPCSVLRIGIPKHPTHIFYIIKLKYCSCANILNTLKPADNKSIVVIMEVITDR